MKGTTLPRHVSEQIDDARKWARVLVHGPRQAGKTTLARLVGERTGGSFVTLDDPVVLEAARRDPVGSSPNRNRW